MIDARTPPWIHAARRYLGVREIPGPATSPVIGKWLHALRAYWTDDETPWCGALPAIVMQECGLAYPKAWYRARAWLDWGEPCSAALGAVAIFERGGGGHVGFVVGKDHMSRLMILGGNQGNRVSIAPFEWGRLLGCRWPAERHVAFEFTGELPRLVYTGPASRSEA